MANRTFFSSISIGLGLIPIVLLWPVHFAGAQARERTLHLPAPSHRDGIGTRVEAQNRSDPLIQTFVREVTLSEPVLIRRMGLEYYEVRGIIEGVGWGGENGYARLESHYTYKVPYVLRVPVGWRGTLVVFRHGAAPLVFWKGGETSFGPRNTGRIFHEVADRFISDVAVEPARRWAFFSANYTPYAMDGRLSSFLLPGTDDDNDGRIDEDPGQDDDGDGLEDEDPRDFIDNDLDGLIDEDVPVDDDRDGRINEDPGRTPIQLMQDATLARDTTLVAKRLLKVITTRTPTVTLGTGHSGGSNQNMVVNIGVDSNRVTGRRIRIGDNFEEAYDPASSKIFDGFLAFGGGGGANGLPIDPALGLSAPTVFVAGEADAASIAVIRQVKEMIDRGLNAASLARVYMVRNVAHIDSDLVRGLRWDPPEQFARGAGDRLKPLTAALLDALYRWVAEGTAPPQSMINGVPIDLNGDGVVDSLRFPQSTKPGPVSTFSFPYVDDPTLDRASGPITNLQNNAALSMAWATVQQTLRARIESIVLPETACRRGRFSFVVQGPVTTQFVPFDARTLAAMWGTTAHLTCRVQTVDGLIARGLYNPTVVTIDIRPDEFPNRIDPRDSGQVPVAILSTIGFDASYINPGSLRLGGASTAIRDRGEIKDVNGDGRPDLLVHFPSRDLSLSRPDDAVMELEGRTWSGLTFNGTDLVDFVE
jgi:hypothetical protein